MLRVNIFFFFQMNDPFKHQTIFINLLFSDLLNSLRLCDKSQELIYKEKYESILQDFEEFKKRSVVNETNQPNNDNVTSNNETQLQRAKSHNKNLEEKVRMLVAEISEKEKDFRIKSEKQQQLIQDQYSRTEQLLAQKDSEHLNKIAILEQQLLRQRERSLAVIQEKDKEIQMLKSSFEALLPKKSIMFDSGNQALNLQTKQGSIKSEASDLMSGILALENNPPMLYYTQELARKEVQISGLRKQNVQLETSFRELERNCFHVAEKHEEEVKKLETQMKRYISNKLKRCGTLISEFKVHTPSMHQYI